MEPNSVVKMWAMLRPRICSRRGHFAMRRICSAWLGVALTVSSPGQSRTPGERALPTSPLQSQASPKPGKTVYLLLHGLNSDASIWDAFVARAFARQCPVLTGTILDTNVGGALCYRYNFLTRIGADGRKWRNGDGGNFAQLGGEVARVVEELRSKLAPSAIVLIGHSRGGLAARAFLQDWPNPPGIKFGLLTIGTPHLGTPVGKLPWFYGEEGARPDHWAMRSLDFMLSPSAAAMAQTVIDGRPVRTQVSASIWQLADGASKVKNSVSVIGEMFSTGLGLGENIVFGINLFADSTLNPMRLLPGDFSLMRGYVLAGVAKGWMDGDNIVPIASARLSSLPGIRGNGIAIFATAMHGKVHSDPISYDDWLPKANPSNSIAGQIDSIQLMLQRMTKQSGFVPFAVKI